MFSFPYSGRFWCDRVPRFQYNRGMSETMADRPDGKRRVWARRCGIAFALPVVYVLSAAPVIAVCSHWQPANRLTRHVYSPVEVLFDAAPERLQVALNHYTSFWFHTVGNETCKKAAFYR